MSDSTLTADHREFPNPEAPVEPRRRVSGWLWLGIAVLPFVFAWFTLRKGHTTRDKAIAFVWLIIYIAVRGTVPHAASASDADAQRQPTTHAQPAQTVAEPVRRLSPEQAMEQYAQRIEARGGVCQGIANHLRMISNNFGAHHPKIAETLGKAEQYGCL